MKVLDVNGVELVRFRNHGHVGTGKVHLEKEVGETRCGRHTKRRGWTSLGIGRLDQVNCQRCIHGLRADGHLPALESVEDKFWSRVDRSQGPDACWVWLGGKTTGYGNFSLPGGKKILAHRFTYERLIGSIPTGLQLDHLCRNRACVNPNHLEPVTQTENIRRGSSPAASAARKTHCLRGHPLSGDNLYVNPGGRRQCHTCTRLRARANYAKSRLTALPPSTQTEAVTAASDRSNA